MVTLQRALSTIILATLLFAWLAVPAARGERDYSDPEQWRGHHNYYDPEWKDLLRNVNAYHLFPGSEKMFKRQYQFAFEDFDFMLRYFPNHPDALKKMGELSLLMGEPDKGESYYKTAIELYPKSIKPQTYVDYGEFLRKEGKTSNSINACNTALSMRPDMAEAHYCLGMAYFATKEYKLANEHAQKVYAKGFQQTELRDKLMSVKAWTP